MSAGLSGAARDELTLLQQYVGSVNLVIARLKDLGIEVKLTIRPDQSDYLNVKAQLSITMPIELSVFDAR